MQETHLFLLLGYVAQYFYAETEKLSKRQGI